MTMNFWRSKFKTTQKVSRLFRTHCHILSFLYSAIYWIFKIYCCQNYRYMYTRISWFNVRCWLFSFFSRFIVNIVKSKSKSNEVNTVTNMVHVGIMIVGVRQFLMGLVLGRVLRQYGIFIMRYLKENKHYRMVFNHTLIFKLETYYFCNQKMLLSWR